MDSNPKKNKFRPQQFNSKLKLKLRLGIYNWQPRFGWSLKNYLHHVFSVLHYKSRHAPGPIMKKWHVAARRFERKHQKII